MDNVVCFSREQWSTLREQYDTLVDKLLLLINYIVYKGGDQSNWSWIYTFETLKPETYMGEQHRMENKYLIFNYCDQVMATSTCSVISVLWVLSWGWRTFIRINWKLLYVSSFAIIYCLPSVFHCYLSVSNQYLYALPYLIKHNLFIIHIGDSILFVFFNLVYQSFYLYVCNLLCLTYDSCSTDAINFIYMYGKSLMRRNFGLSWNTFPRYKISTLFAEILPVVSA